MPERCNRMQTFAVAEVQAAEGLGPLGLNDPVPNEQKDTALLMQPQGDFQISGAGVRNCDHASAAAQFGAFLRDARETDADLVVTPEYSMPWSTLTAALRAASIPSHWIPRAIGCESIRYNELQQLKQGLARFTSCVLQSGVALPFRTIKTTIAGSLNLVIHVERRPGCRYISEVLLVNSYDPDAD
jgi:hypothetical protein